MQRLDLFCLISWIIISLNVQLFSKNIYVDNTLSSDCTSGNYSIKNRDCSGSDGDAYRTIQTAINTMTPGDHILIRGGVYREGHINIPLNKNGSGWEEGNYNKLSSFPNEWAILDGEQNLSEKYGSIIGHPESEFADSYDLKYWMFERLEISNGGRSDGEYAAGFAGNGGPFIFRYCYIHDNVANNGGNNPAGIRVYHMHDSIIEYCYFKENGMSTGEDNNPANIAIFSDYNHSNIAQNGADINSTTYVPTHRNEIRYNYIVGSCVGFKHKSGQLLSGRNPDGGHGWDDSLKDYGDKIHHNIIRGARSNSLMIDQDFCQVYNNIIVEGRRDIMIQYEPGYQFYKVVTYNNTFINTSQQALVRYSGYIFFSEPAEHYGWDYNNIFDSCGSTSNYCRTDNLSACPSGTSGCGTDNYDLSNYYCSNNYFYRPDGTSLIRLQNQSYTKSGFEQQQISHAPRVIYSNNYNSADPLYRASSGADKYKTFGKHIVSGSTTIANGGIGGPHPYLTGVQIPSYIGAVDPNDDSWVDVVLNLENLPQSSGTISGKTPKNLRIEPIQ